MTQACEWLIRLVISKTGSLSHIQPWGRSESDLRIGMMQLSCKHWLYSCYLSVISVNQTGLQGCWDQPKCRCFWAYINKGWNSDQCCEIIYCRIDIYRHVRHDKWDFKWPYSELTFLWVFFKLSIWSPEISCEISLQVFREQTLMWEQTCSLLIQKKEAKWDWLTAETWCKT